MRIKGTASSENFQETEDDNWTVSKFFEVVIPLESTNSLVSRNAKGNT